jgi:hypothetical protein
MDRTGTFAVTSNMVLTAVYVSAGDARWKSFQEIWDVLLGIASAAPVTAGTPLTVVNAPPGDTPVSGT